MNRHQQELSRTCPEFRRTLRTNRRGFLKVGVLGSSGLSLSGLLRAEAQAAQSGRPTGKEKNNVIILWMRGGPPQHDLWDPKPEAPAEIRGEYHPIDTAVPGIQITHMLPLSARCMDKWSIIRSLHHNDPGHSGGDQLMFTGYPRGTNPDVNVHPSCGSIVARQLGHLDRTLPAYVMIPRMVPGTDAAYLGPAYKPFETLADPANDGPFRLPNFRLVDGLSVDRLGDRRALLRDLDRMRRDMDQTGAMEAMDEFHQHAWDMITSPEAQRAFDLDAEPREVRERYGFFPAFVAPTPDRCGVPAWSQRVLLARRLVEAGVRLVTVDLRWWDTHVQNYDSLGRGFLPRFDKCFSALMEDLDERGLLETTLVVAVGEFGRTPRINNNAGRDHYCNVFSAAIAGGAVRGGRVLGSSDAHGAFPKDRPVTPLELLATIYWHVGVDPEVHYPDNSGRPIVVLPSGKPLWDLMS